MKKTRRRRGCLIALVIAAIGVAAVFVFMRVWKPLGGRIEGARLQRVQASPHWRDGKFQNLIPTHELLPGTVGKTFYLQFFGGGIREPEGPLPIHALSELRKEDGLRAVWIGHSSVIVDLDGVRILTDPIWSDRCSPFASIGPRRFHPPPIALDAVGDVDAVVISHDHYDHLDMATIQSLSRRGVLFFVPLGVGAHLERWGVPAAQLRELEWDQSAMVKGVNIVCFPARHYSGRGFVRNTTLWATWALVGPRHRVFFSGDTGFFGGLRNIGDRLGPFDLTIIKIGAYGPTWPEIHLNPEEAVETHVALQGKLMLPVHWGTFNLAYHDWFEPPERLMRAAGERIEYVIPRPGEIVDPGKPVPVTRWWTSASSPTR